MFIYIVTEIHDYTDQEKSASDLLLQNISLATGRLNIVFGSRIARLLYQRNTHTREENLN